MTTKLFKLLNCKDCPNCYTEYILGTGYAIDYKCKASNDRVIVGYVEWPSEAPQDGVFPEFCPLPNGESK